jgi:hypothetical protein
MADIPFSPGNGDIVFTAVAPLGPFTSIDSTKYSRFTYKPAPVYWPGNEMEHRRRIAEVVNNLLEGKLNSTASVTLTASSATTTLADRRIGPFSVILFMPQTANAATEMANLHVTSRGQFTATLTHSNDPGTDRTYDYCVLG